MIYALDAYPMYQQAVYQTAPAVMEHSAHGRAGFDADMDAQSAGRVTDARIHCVASTAGQRVAICDNGTLIAMKPGEHGQPAQLVRTVYAPPSPQLALPQAATERFFSSPAPPKVQASLVTRRWLADLLMTFGIGFLLVSSFMFVTSHVATPGRRHRHARV